MKKQIYIASGFFNKKQLEDLAIIKEACEDTEFTYYSPKDECVCPPNASLKIRNNILNDNLKAIKASDIVIVNTRDNDKGTLFESGYAFAKNKRIIYCFFDLNKNVNLMLSQTGIGFVRYEVDLLKILKQLKRNKDFKQTYKGKIE